MAVKDNPEKVVEQAQAEVQAIVDEEHDKGYAGVTADETPREHYTVGGVLAGKPTPENGL